MGKLERSNFNWFEEFGGHWCRGFETTSWEGIMLQVQGHLDWIIYLVRIPFYKGGTRRSPLFLCSDY